MLDKSSTFTTIDEDMVFRGEVEIDGDIVIFGNIEGMLRASRSVHLKSGGKIKGNIKSPQVIVEGTLQGNVREAAFVQIMQAGKVNGDIESTELEVARGAVFSGTSTVRK